LKYFAFFLIWFVHSCCFAQHQTNIDAGTIESRLENGLQQALQHRDFNAALIVSDSIESHARIKKDTMFLAYAFQIRSEIYKFKSDIQSAKENLQKAIDLYTHLKYTSGIVRGNSSMSGMYRMHGQLDSSLARLNKIRPLVEISSDSTDLQYYYNQRSSVLEAMGRPDSAIFYVFKRISITSQQNYYGKGMANLQLASLFYKVQDYKKALDYVDRSIFEFDQSTTPLPSTKLKANVAKSEILSLLGDKDAAREMAEQTLGGIEVGRNANYFAQLHIMLSRLEFDEGATNLVSEKYINGKNISKGVLLRYYTLQIMQAQRLGNSKLAEVAIDKSNTLVDDVNNLILKRRYFEKVSEYWKEHGAFEKSLHSQSQLLEINKQLNDHVKNYTTYDLESKYQLQKKEIQLQLQESEIQKKTLTSKMALALALMFFVVGIGIVLFFKERQRKKDEQLRTIKKEAQITTLESLIKGEEKERVRIAQELHDGLNGDLSAIKFKLNSLNEKNVEGIREAVEMIDKSCDQVRTISHNLIPPALENFDLYLAAIDYCQKMNLNYDPEIEFQYIGEKQEFPKSVEINIYRVIQELVLNSLKHSHASMIHVQLSSINEVLQLTVEDC